MSTSGARRPAKITYDYDAEGENQLSIQKGEQVTVIGEKTAENWVLAQNSKGEQGYIPDGYFEFATTSISGGNFPDRSMSVNSDSGQGYVHQSGVGGVMGKDETWNLFAYQFEWIALLTGGVVALCTLLYFSTEPGTNGILGSVGATVGLVWLAVLMYISGLARDRFECCGGSALTRGILYLIGAIILGCLYPVGTVAGIVCFFAALANFRVAQLDAQALPDSYTGNWCGVMFGGCDNCSSGKLTAFFFWLGVNVGCFIWGFIDGYEQAETITENDATLYYINPDLWGFSKGFGRMITVDLFLLFLYSCYGFLDRRTSALEQSRKTDTMCGRCHLFVADRDRRLFVHRLFAYFIVAGSFGHVFTAYLSYEQSAPVRSFRFAFGEESIITGLVLFGILSILVASSNTTIKQYNAELFRNTHLWSIVFGLMVIFHGEGGANNSTAIGFVAAGVAIYLVDMLMRCGSSGN